MRCRPSIGSAGSIRSAQTSSIHTLHERRTGPTAALEHTNEGSVSTNFTVTPQKPLLRSPLFIKWSRTGLIPRWATIDMLFEKPNNGWLTKSSTSSSFIGMFFSMSFICFFLNFVVRLIVCLFDHWWLISFDLIWLLDFYCSLSIFLSFSFFFLISFSLFCAFIKRNINQQDSCIRLLSRMFVSKLYWPVGSCGGDCER